MLALAFALAVASSVSVDTQAPHFVARGAAEQLDALPLKDVHAEVDVTGVIAHVTLTQVYANEGSTPLEALYVFPGSTRAAVHGMTMRVGRRTLVARIQKRDEARKLYEKARDDGKTASLLEQERPNVFTMSVANIQPGDVVEVELVYSELLLPRDGVYELVVPAVVGPRYTGGGGEKFRQPPHVEGEEPYRYDVAVHLAAGMPIEHLESPSHKVGIASTFRGFDVVLDGDERAPGNRDFILRYTLRGEAIKTGLMMYPGDDEKFFLLNVQPPARVADEDLPPREYIFIVDVSGSMHGAPLQTARSVMEQLLGTLRPVDTFNLLLFESSSRVLAERSVRSTEDNRERAYAMMLNESGGGGTQILPALERALKFPRTANTSRSVVVLTDGYINVEPQVFDVIRNHLGDANLFAFGIGNSVNRHLIEGMAAVGQGESFVVTTTETAAPIVERFASYIRTPALTDITVSFDGLRTYQLTPSHVPDLFAERPISVLGKWKGPAEGKVIVRGRMGTRAFEQVIDVGTASVDTGHHALRELWARERIRSLADIEGVNVPQSVVDEVTTLGLRHSLLTRYTSFVAIDPTQRGKRGSPTTVEQPVPMPDQVSGKGMLGVLGARGMGYGGGGMALGGLAGVSSGRMAAAGEVSGGLDAGSLGRVIRARQRAIQACYESALRNDPALQGKIAVELTIDASGKVTSVRIVDDGMKSTAINACITAELQRLRFPSGSGEVKVRYPFTFTPAK